MKVLVLGGTRFVGLRLVRHLAALGHDLTILNRGRTETALPPGIRRLYADRRDAPAVRAALAGQEFEVAFDMTAYQVRNLQPVVEALAGRVGHFVFQSTAAVYAPASFLPITEDFPLEPPGPPSYGGDKARCEEYLLQAFRDQGFPATIIRCPVIYGPENWMDEREGSFFARLLLGRRLLVPGNGATFLHQVHVDDVAQAHAAVMGQTKALGQVFNIASAHAITINAYLDAIAGAVGRKAEKVCLDLSVMGGLKRPVFPFDWEQSACYSIQKAQEGFGFRPRFDMASGLADTYRWWSRERGLERIRFEPGRAGWDVDLAYEDELLKQYG